MCLCVSSSNNLFQVGHFRPVNEPPVAQTRSMDRSIEVELLDTGKIPEPAVAKAYQEISWVNRVLGNDRAILRLLREDVHPPNRLRVLDIGCGQGALLLEIQQQLGAAVIGMDMRPAPCLPPVPILSANAITDELPDADVAICVLTAHHLAPAELGQMIRNVSRSCDRLILLDLIRDPLPLWLFRLFVAPLLGPINVADGKTSIRKAYTAAEMRTIVNQTLRIIPRKVLRARHTIAACSIRQIVDIRWQKIQTEEPQQETA